MENNITYDNYDIIWHKVISLKVNLYVRRLFQNRIPTTDNLTRQRVLQNNDQLCVKGCSSYENVNHMLLRCDFSGTIWY